MEARQRISLLVILVAPGALSGAGGRVHEGTSELVPQADGVGLPSGWVDRNR